jgi:hypothetical protein
MQAEQDPAAQVPSSSIDIAAAKRKARRGQQRDSRKHMNSTPGRARGKRALGAFKQLLMLCCMCSSQQSALYLMLALVHTLTSFCCKSSLFAD